MVVDGGGDSGRNDPSRPLPGNQQAPCPYTYACHQPSLNNGALPPVLRIVREITAGVSWRQSYQIGCRSTGFSCIDWRASTPSFLSPNPPFNPCLFFLPPLNPAFCIVHCAVCSPEDRSPTTSDFSWKHRGRTGPPIQGALLSSPFPTPRFRETGVPSSCVA